MELSLNGHTALVCGASQGIGRATAISLAKQGAKVIALARSEEKLVSLMSDLTGEGHSFLALDLTDRENLKAKVSSKITEVNGIDILICNTGGPKGGPIIDAEEDNFITGFENHVLVNSLLAKLVVPHMKQTGFGRIINIISTSVKAPIPNLGVSNTIRGAVASWAKTLSFELAASGITVNNVLPGYTNTPRLDILLQGAADRQGISKDEAIKQWKNKVPARRFAEPEELANAVTFLSSKAASYINGVSLPVDGGRTVCL